MSDLDISPHGPTRVSLTRVGSPDEPVELILLILIQIMNNDYVNDYTNNGLSIYFAFDPLPHNGRKSLILAPQEIPDISGYQWGFGCQFVKAYITENPVTNQKIL